MTQPTPIVDPAHLRPTRAAFAALAAVGMLLLCAAPAGAGRGEVVGAARNEAVAATRARIAAEDRLAQATAKRTRLEQHAADLDSSDAASASELATARQQVRQLAVAAFIDGGRTELLQATLEPQQASLVAWRVGVLSGGAGNATNAVDRFEELQAANDPEQRSVAVGLDAARSGEEQARSDLVQASARERDAEAALSAAKDAARAAAAQAAAQRAAVQSVPVTSVVGIAPTAGAPVAAPTRAKAVPATSSAAGLGVAPSTGGATAEEAAFLAKVRQCESNGNYSVVSASGRYRGAYQFSVETWRGVGGSGDPAAASPAEQDARALALLRLQGKRAWPVCSRR
ncbi:MAG TPA: transglycosylase family protein [Microthrixaceae bacterium]|mgnify:FL=1|nr:transglycosylase family protein [Microthrixaceae bacterium]